MREAEKLAEKVEKEKIKQEDAEKKAKLEEDKIKNKPSITKFFMKSAVDSESKIKSTKTDQDHLMNEPKIPKEFNSEQKHFDEEVNKSFSLYEITSLALKFRKETYIRFRQSILTRNNFGSENTEVNNE